MKRRTITPRKRNTVRVSKTATVNFSETDKLFTEVATRERSIDYHSALYYLPNPDPVLKKSGNSIEVYEEISSDPYVSLSVQRFMDGVKEKEWDIDRGRSKSKNAKIMKDIFTNLSDVGDGMSGIIEAVLNARLYGYQPIEVLWERVGDLAVPVNLVAKPQEWFTFNSDSSLQLLLPGSLQSEPVDDFKFLCPKFRATYKNPYGLGVLSACFWPVAFKKGGLKFFVNFAEKYGMPYIIGKHKFTNPKDVTGFMNDLSNMIQDGVMAIGLNNQEVEVVPTGTTANADIFDRLINTMRKEIQAAILNHDSAGASTAGELGNNNSALTASQSVINSGKNLVQQCMNQLIGWIFEVNKMSGDRPRFVFFEEDDVDKELAERDAIVAGGPLNTLFTEDYLKRIYKYEDGDLRPDAFKNNPTQPTLPPADFTEAGIGDDQKGVDSIFESIINSGELSVLSSDFVESVLNYVDGKSTYEDALSDIASQYGKANVSDLEKLLKKTAAAAHTLGRHSANG